MRLNIDENVIRTQITNTYCHSEVSKHGEMYLRSKEKYVKHYDWIYIELAATGRTGYNLSQLHTFPLARLCKQLHET